MISKIIIMLVAASMCVSPVVYNSLNKQDVPVSPHKNIIPDEQTYENSIKIEQESLKLDHEYIQYKLEFHENATVDFKIKIKYVVMDLEPVSYHVYLTDGEKPVAENTMLFFSYEPAGLFFDLVMLKHYIRLGGKLFFKSMDIGQDIDVGDKIEVVKGDSWYLTIGVQNSKCEEISVSFESSTDCMEVVELERGTEIEYYSVFYNDFEGFYFGIKILFFGFSIAKDVKKTITTEKGSLIALYSVGQRRGTASIKEPDGTIVTKESEEAFIVYHYAGNQTGSWEFTVSGIGFPLWRQIIALTYIDVDPHCKNENVTW